MKLRLGYPDRIVEVDGKVVRVFKGRLVSAPLSEVVGYYLKGEGLLPPAVRDVVPDIVRALLSTGELHSSVLTITEYGHGISS
ncbi:hypothetical protein [Thermococcus thioreducens]|uniref:Uncharacterized protein n=1 Tax=Thermococcus thioreducens TaxID=277988 RepID=A0A0Q2S3P9_9EURY|nr:hypothetical protein [Thermococcus thioreducens]ASJ12909.1 hypothetical protein A3L14_08435 [Thermococcus thioreducens]KQH82099.1 hypothetical protein AMR53_07715 [Thermococcus thioreducens]SEV83553.1 hypothetical protein SAMN05216170_0258 [Thermococcus thioreducens]